MLFVGILWHFKGTFWTFLVERSPPGETVSDTCGWLCAPAREEEPVVFRAPSASHGFHDPFAQEFWRWWQMNEDIGRSCVSPHPYHVPIDCKKKQKLSRDLRGVRCWSEEWRKTVTSVSDNSSSCRTVVDEKPQVTKTIFSDNNQTWGKEIERKMSNVDRQWYVREEAVLVMMARW